MKNSISLLLIASLFQSAALFAQEDKPSGKIESQQIIIQKNGSGSESLSIKIDGDNVTVNGKPLSDYDDKNVTVKKKKMIISDGNRVIIDEDEASGSRDQKANEPKAFLGVTSETAEKGARIMAITKGSAAEKAGLKRGDVITKINSSKIDGPASLTEAINKAKPGEQVKIRFDREGKEKTVKAELGERADMVQAPRNSVRSFSFSMPNGDMKSFDIPDMDLGDLDMNGIFQMPDISDLNIDITGAKKPKLGLKIQDTENGKGVKVLDVEENSTSFRAGIKKDDVITSINEKAVNNTDEAREQLKESNAGDSYKIKLIREGKEMSFDVSIPRKLKTIDL